MTHTCAVHCPFCFQGSHAYTEPFSILDPLFFPLLPAHQNQYQQSYKCYRGSRHRATQRPQSGDSARTGRCPATKPRSSSNADAEQLNEEAEMQARLHLQVIKVDFSCSRKVKQLRFALHPNPSDLLARLASAALAAGTAP